ncbi:ABC transporter ATP-binding protein [Pseudonocardia sp. NPDC049154]|uniref:ABC transporter ATP-binding protein n=1 Tax=Pseudonocardia sp. NPDC049154 TaxID=3155501 RepID=UPI0033D99FAD
MTALAAGTRTVVVEARGLNAGYGAVPVVTDLDMQVRAGEIVCLVGSNGAGKTTSLLTLAGELSPQGGQVVWRGRTERMSLDRRARDGLRFVTEERSIFPTLTTAENLRLGGGSPQRALELFPELEPLLKRPARLLSGGEQQMLTLARALSGNPVALFADELSLGLAPKIVTRLLDAVQAAARSGVAVLLVEQHVRQALQVSDRGYVMRRGRVELEGTAADLLERIDEIEASYLSAGHEDRPERKGTAR